MHGVVSMDPVLITPTAHLVINLGVIGSMPPHDLGYAKSMQVASYQFQAILHEHACHQVVQLCTHEMSAFWTFCYMKYI